MVSNCGYLIITQATTAIDNYSLSTALISLVAIITTPFDSPVFTHTTAQTLLPTCNLQMIHLPPAAGNPRKSNPRESHWSRSSRYGPPWSHTGRRSLAGAGCDLNGRCSRNPLNHLFERGLHYLGPGPGFCLKLEILLFSPERSQIW